MCNNINFWVLAILQNGLSLPKLMRGEIRMKEVEERL